MGKGDYSGGGIGQNSRTHAIEIACEKKKEVAVRKREFRQSSTCEKTSNDGV